MANMKTAYENEAKFKNYVKVFTCNRIIVILQSILEFPWLRSLRLHKEHVQRLPRIARKARSALSYFVLSENKEARSESQLMIICKRYGEGIHLKEKDSRKGNIRFFVLGGRWKLEDAL